MKYSYSNTSRATTPPTSNPRSAIIRTKSYDSLNPTKWQQEALQWEENQENQWNKDYEEYITHYAAADYDAENPYELAGQNQLNEGKHGRALMRKLSESRNMSVVLQMYDDLKRSPIDQKGSAEGKPCPNTKKAMVDALEALNHMDEWKLKLTFNDTVFVEYPLDWRKEMPTDATFKDENGEVCLVYSFYKYPFVENWGKFPMRPEYKKPLTEVCDRIIGSKCAYAVVDDGYSSMVIALNMPKLPNSDEFDREPLQFYRLNPGYGGHIWWMLKALDNSKKHRVMLKKYMTYNHHLDFDR